MSKQFQTLLSFCARALLVAVTFMSPGPLATAATKNWNAINGSWAGLSGGNWSPSGVPAGGDTANIVFADALSRTVTYDYTGGALTLAQLNIDQTGAGQSTLSMSANSLTSFGEWIGVNGHGVFNHSGGTNRVGSIGFGGVLDIGVYAGTTGTYNLSGAGSLESLNHAYLGDVGTGNFNQSGGSFTLGSHNLYLGFNAAGGASGTYTLSGGSLSASAVDIGTRSTGVFNQSGGTNTAEFVALGDEAGAVGSYNLTAGTLTSSNLIVGNFGAGVFNQHGGTAVTQTVEIGNFSGSAGTYKIDGGTLSASDDILVGSPGAGALTILNQASVYISDSLSIGSLGTVNLNGGTLRLNGYSNSGSFNYNAGTIQLAGGRTIGSDLTVQALFGSAPTITTGKGLTVEGTATLLTAVTLDGGTLTVGGIVNGSNLHFLRGTLSITSEGLVIGAGSQLGSTLDLAPDMTINVPNGTTNLGLVTGDGEIGGTFANALTGELRAEPGRSLKLTGANNTNNGQINLYGGMLDFTQGLTNNAGAFISGNGTIKATTGLTNNGTMNFSGLSNVVGDVTNSSTGKIISSGGGPTTFLDDVTNNGEIRTSAGSFTVFFGAANGAGAYSGLGTVNFEGDLKPGNSAAQVNFAGDVVLGADSTLQIEIGGVTAGSQHDQVNVAGELTLGGTLEVSLINGFDPELGQTFDIMNTGSLAGAFSSVVLPSLDGFAWNTSQLAMGILSVVPALAADFDEDGDVDGADLTRWRNNFGTGTTHMTGDADGDADADGADFLTWQRQLGGPAAVAATVAVPEPATLLTPVLGVLLIFRRRDITESRG